MCIVLAGDPILDLVQPDNLRNPYPAYALLREKQPVFWYEPLSSWILTRHADCVDVLRDSGRFAADWRRVGEEVPPQAVSIQTLDPPEHTAIRRLLVDAFRAQHVSKAERTVVEHTRRRLAELRNRSSFDIVTDFAEPLALSTITSYLGVPTPEAEWFVPAMNAVADGMDAGLWPERGERAMAARLQLSELAETWLADAPPDGLVGAVVASAKFQDVPHAFIANTLRVLLHAGYTSASKLLGLAVAALLHEHGSGLRALPAANQAAAMEELVRYTSPVQAMARVCVVNTTLGGNRIQAGQAVTLILGAANRDPTRFDKPDNLQLDRHPNPHLGFGRGAHSCLGSPFAVMQARVVLSVLADQHPALHLAGPPAYRHNLTLRGLQGLEVSVT